MAKNCLILFNLSEGLLGTIKKRNQLNGNEMIVSGSDPAIFGPKRAFFRPLHCAHDWMMVMAETALNQLRTYMPNDYSKVSIFLAGTTKKVTEKAKNVMVWAKLRFKGRVLASKAFFLSISMRN